MCSKILSLVSYASCKLACEYVSSFEIVALVVVTQCLLVADRKCKQILSSQRVTFSFSAKISAKRALSISLGLW